MDNQQETKVYVNLGYILVGSSETIREAPLNIYFFFKGWRNSPTLFERLGIIYIYKIFIILIWQLLEVYYVIIKKITQLQLKKD